MSCLMTEMVIEVQEWYNADETNCKTVELPQQEQALHKWEEASDD